MAVIAPTPIDAGPIVPSSADSETTFDAAYEAFNAWEKNQLQPQANALAANVFNNATEAKSEANKAFLYADQALTYRNSANTAADTAIARANEAAASAGNSAISAGKAEAAFDAFDDRYLGQKSTPPTTDNDGEPLLVGALYFRTTAPVGMKVWTGTAWDDAYANLSSKFDKVGGTISGSTTIQVSSDSAAGLLIENTDTGGLNTAAALLFKAGPTVAAQIAMLRAPSTLTFESFNSSELVFSTGGSVLRIGPSTGTRVTGGALGYGVGSGGSVVQATSKSTAVTLNKPSGQITMRSESLASGASVSFVFNNSFLDANDGVLIRPNGFTGYAVEIEYSLSATSVVVRVTNRGATRSDPLALVFQIVKGAIP